MTSAAPRFAVARCANGHARFFIGRYAYPHAMPIGRPITSQQPERAKTYDDQVAAQIVVNFFNAIEGVVNDKPSLTWLVVELPEAWT